MIGLIILAYIWEFLWIILGCTIEKLNRHSKSRRKHDR